MKNFCSRRVLVTGGAIRVGAVIARAFADAGATVIVHCRRSRKEAEELLASFPGTGHQIVCGDLTEQLLPYYSGNVICETAIPPLSDGKHLYMDLPRWNGSALGVVINDSKEIDATFCKGVLDITAYLKNDGENRIRIILYGHRRNSFGPFYLRNPKPFWTDCAVFRKQETANRNLVPFGLADAVKFFED